MKLQRWIVGDGVYPNEPDRHGEWCKAHEVAALEAENESLRAEIERLKAPEL